jgi:hypothetical protein
VGAVAANVYVQSDLSGVLAQGLSAQAAEPQICVNSGSFTAEGQTLHFIYAATEPNLCAIFQQVFPQGGRTR